MKRVWMSVALVLVLCAAGCRQADTERRYELLPSERGVYRFDNETGNVAVVTGKGLLTLESLPAPTRDEEAELGAIRSFPPIVLEDLGGVTATLTTRWWYERLYYRVTLEPPEPGLPELYSERPSMRIIMRLKSLGGFVLATYDFPVRTFEKTRDESGSTTGLEYSAWEVMSADVYRQLVQWNLWYRLES